MATLFTHEGYGPRAFSGGFWSWSRALNRAVARSLFQFTTPSRTGTVVEMPAPRPRMARPSWARFQTWSPLSTVIALDRSVARGTSRNGLASTAGLTTLSSKADRKARWRSTRPKSDVAVARVRT